MKKEVINIENLKCGGCAASIKKGIESISAVKAVEVNLEDSQVSISYDGVADRNVFIEALAKMGYPELGTGTTLQKVKSYVSCAVGRMQS